MRRITFSLFLFMAVFVSFSAYADTWYVSPEGDDGNDGTEENPWQTIQHAVNQATAGDTIKVIDNDDESTDDYVENISVNKSLTIERYNDSGANPQVKANDTNDHVFTVTADDVTIRGLDIYGVTVDSKSGIYLSGVSNCTIQNNRCGWDSDHMNYHGIYLFSSSDNTISGNICNSNSLTNGFGILLEGSNGNSISDNTCNSNYGYGIFVRGSHNTISHNTASNSITDAGIFVGGSNNTIDVNTASNNGEGEQGIRVAGSNNTIINNITTSNYYGIYLCSGSTDNIVMNNDASNNSLGILLYSSYNNTISGNTCDSNEDYGIELHSSSYNTVSGNTCNSNNYGIALYLSSNNNTVYLNNFSNNPTNVYSDSTNIWHSPTKLGYLYGSSKQKTKKSYMGNYYDDYSGSDGDNDGIGDISYDLPDSEPDDEYPLMQPSDNYDLQTWWLSNPVMYRDDMSQAGDTVTIGANSSGIWTADQATLTDITFGGLDSWTGQITLTASTTVYFTVEIGYADDQSGTNFWASGPEVSITGTDSVFQFNTDDVGFTVAEGKYLVMRIKDNSGSSNDVRVGGSWSYCSAPQASQDYSLPVELSFFTATVSDGKVTILWGIETEVGNVGFSIYRSDAKDGKYTKIAFVEGAINSAMPIDYEFTDKKAEAGKTYYYYLEDIDITGERSQSEIIQVVVPDKPVVMRPNATVLMQNYPNPFNPETWIPYQLKESSEVTISIYDVSGQLVRRIALNNLPAGMYVNKDKAAYWDGKNSFREKVSSGLYFYTIQAGEYRATKRMLILK